MLKQLVYRLRRKIEDKKDKSRPRYIVSERGAGYSFHGGPDATA